MTRPILIAAALALSGCAAPTPEAASARDALRPDFVDAKGRCFSHDMAPAVIETVTRQEIAAPAQRDDTGAVTAPARYRTVTEQRIVRERQKIRFPTPCPNVFTLEFVESLQRALQARGLYRGPVDGDLSPATGAAIRRFQKGFGPDSQILSLEAAQRLGLVRLSREQIDLLDGGFQADPFSEQ
ncbi:MAG: hypothetical protein CSA72_04830 [Rhodobacterales bacterium]|nr:MAG: hypothetical protein CSA72_04830 [Rhodobacterales bacterium]